MFASETRAGQAAAPVIPPPADGPVNRKRAVAVGTVAAVLIAGAGAVAWAYIGDVPRGTKILGVDLGGRSRSDAERRLTDAVGPRTGDPVAVDLAGERFSIEAADIALRLDVGRSIGKAIKGSPRLAGERTVLPVIELDEAKLERTLRGRLDPRKITLKRPGIAYTGLTPRPTYPAAGQGLDVAAAATTVRQAWLVGGVATIGLVTKPPETTREQVDALVADLATPAVAAPVTVTVGDESLVLTPKAIARGLVFRSDDDGLLTPAIDGDKLHAAAAEEFAAVEEEPEQATITLADGRPKIVADSPGDMVDLAKLGPALLAVLGNPAPRSVEAVLSAREAATTEADLAKLGVKEKVSTFTTYFTGGKSSPRSQNIMTVARAVDGAVVPPGATFSLNKHTGDRDYAAGYQDAPVIVGGKLEPGVGGGASQFTTTLFNAAYYAGLQDVEHKPHSFYFSRYPAVIESTIFYPTLDLKFKNTTPYGVLIDTSYTGRSVTVALWSTKVYDSVRTIRSPRRGITSPPTVYREPGPKCIASSGLPGFTQDAWRVIRKDGKEIEREKFTWRYDPEPRFICGAKP
ncbi:vanomycin resistance protein VanB [Actinoplanes sp. ATCC 53533]|uniref:VanW family protein n=1 Tax=Actinoplanes sp. ATCC 53533 TaxID=1288362 RepID=UPI000F78E71F|nr:VanW family protein [Actinoplanes sp. ATCC 53533]RSM67828.1 vanomycin resistance protein VanB [Actinoplanes sp. ATCC 53533]